MLSLAYLAELAQNYPEAAVSRVREFALGSEVFPFNSKLAIMGVINLSPDSMHRT